MSQKRARTVPRKRFGQHFLHERGIIERIVRSIDPQPGDVPVEVGPGEGALTRPLLEYVPRMDAIEIDRDLAVRLAAEFPPRRLTLHVADVLEFDFHLARYASRVRDMHFMLQLEVVERMVANHSTKEYGRLSVMLQTKFRVDKLFRVPAGAFTPPPKVASAVVRLVPRSARALEGVDEKTFRTMVAAAFSARRKTLRKGTCAKMRRP